MAKPSNLGSITYSGFRRLNRHERAHQSVHFGMVKHAVFILWREGVG